MNITETTRRLRNSIDIIVVNEIQNVKNSVVLAASDVKKAFLDKWYNTILKRIKDH